MSHSQLGVKLTLSKDLCSMLEERRKETLEQRASLTCLEKQQQTSEKKLDHLDNNNNNNNMMLAELTTLASSKSGRNEVDNDKIGFMKSIMPVVVDDDHLEDRRIDQLTNSAMMNKINSNIITTINEDDVIMPFDSGHIMHKEKDDDDNDNENSTHEYNDDDDDRSAFSSTKSSIPESDDNDDELSISPPPSLPLLVVNLESLCGYTPPDEEEARTMRLEIYQALLGSTHQNKSDDKADTNYHHDKIQEEDTSHIMDFEPKTEELFETGIASHSDTSSIHTKNNHKNNNQTLLFATNNTTDNSDDNFKFAIIPYPEYLPMRTENTKHKHAAENNNTDDNLSIQRTERIWKQIIHPYTIPKRFTRKNLTTYTNQYDDMTSVITRLLCHLSNCCRPLTWKYQMNLEIRRLAYSELLFLTHKIETEELHIWKTVTRPRQLDKLYQVRETFELQLQTAQEKYDQLLQKQQERIQAELQSRQKSGVGLGGVGALDWQPKLMDPSFYLSNDSDKNKKSSTTLQNYHDNDDNNNDSSNSIDSGYEYSYNEADDDYDDRSNLTDSSENELDNKGSLTRSEVLLAMQNENKLANHKRRRRRQRKKRKQGGSSMKQKLAAMTQEAKRVEQEGILKKAQAEEDAIRELCTTNEDRIACAVVDNLQQRMQDVEDLLERLQEEEWADEEEQYLENYNQQQQLLMLQQQQEENSNKDGMSLLDQILAMILGALPENQLQHSPLSQKEHYLYVKNEHDAIVQKWKSSFGRLPLPVSITNNAARANDRQEPHKLENEDLDNRNYVDDDNNDDATETLAMDLHSNLSIQKDISHFKDNRSMSKSQNSKIKNHPEQSEKEIDSAVQQRSTFGILENDNVDDWDDVDDWDKLIPQLATDEKKNNNSNNQDYQAQEDIIGYQPGIQKQQFPNNSPTVDASLSALEQRQRALVAMSSEQINKKKSQVKSRPSAGLRPGGKL